MLVQITAYPVFGSLMLLAQVHETSPTGRSYTCLVQEAVDIPGGVLESDPWDLLWLLSSELLRRADERRTGA